MDQETAVLMIIILSITLLILMFVFAGTLVHKKVIPKGKWTWHVLTSFLSHKQILSDWLLKPTEYIRIAIQENWGIVSTEAIPKVGTIIRIGDSEVWDNWLITDSVQVITPAGPGFYIVEVQYVSRDAKGTGLELKWTSG